MNLTQVQNPKGSPQTMAFGLVCTGEQLLCGMKGGVVLLTVDRSSWFKPGQHHCTAHFCIALQLQNIIELFGF